MALVVLVTFKAQPERYAEFIDFLKSALPDTRAFEGCLGLEVAADEETASVTLFEIWRNKDAQLAYRAWRADTGSAAQFAAFVREPPVFADYDLLEIPRS